MKEMLLFVALGVALVTVFVLLLWRSGPPNRQDEAAQGAKDPERRSLPPEIMIERIFGADDWKFLRGRACKAAEEEFLKERTEIAFFWLARIRARVRTIMYLHLTQASVLQALEPALELRVAANYLRFQINCSFVACLLWLRGPEVTGKMFRNADLLCGKLGALTRVRSEDGSRSMLVKG